MAENAQHIETVVIEEPSDKVELASDEKPRCNKTRVYVALGLLVVIAVSLIGTLLSFSPSSNGGINQQTLTEGTQATFPTFDTNNDGFIDQNEMSNWMSERIAARKHFCTPEDPEPIQTVTSDTTTTANGTTPTTGEVNNMMSPCDFDHDGKVSRTEAVQCVIFLFELFIKQFGHTTPPRTMNIDALNTAIATQTTPTGDCTVPLLPGFPGKVPHGWVGACKVGMDLWCFTHEMCHHHQKCHREVIPGSWQVQDTCCGGTSGANCTTCSCGGTFHFVPHGHNARATSMCHKLSTFWCGDVDTGVPVW
jgi:hypothetical protein